MNTRNNNAIQAIFTDTIEARREKPGPQGIRPIGTKTGLLSLRDRSCILAYVGMSNTLIRQQRH